MNNSIFVQIASYRDPQLVPTINDLIYNAKNPGNLIIGIAWQHSDEDEWDNLETFKNDNRFKVIDIPYSESSGVCWARSQTQKLYSGEQYTLQIDSHHRFVKDWDDKLIKMIDRCQQDGYAKPLLTAYLPSFDPDKGIEGRIDQLWKMNFDKFIPEGAVFFRPGIFDQSDHKDKPLPARFFSGHFAFTLGSFCSEVPYDPNYYFHGEEINMGVRAFTHGYDLFHPNEVICWHEYTRKNRIKQWDDDKVWFQKNASSHERNRKLFGMDNEKNNIDFGIYGFGNVRSLQDYERYAGISFKYRSITNHTRKFLCPPDPYYQMSYLDFEKALSSKFECTIPVLDNFLMDINSDFWAIICHNIQGKELYRYDIVGEDIKRAIIDKHIKVKFYGNEQPYSWTIWPYQSDQGWLQKVVGKW